MMGFTWRQVEGFFDYVALGFILERVVAFLHQGAKDWPIWIPG